MHDFKGFQTTRLLVTRWHPSRDAAPLGALLTPQVLTHLPSSLQTSDPEPWITERLAESDVFAIERSGALIGVMLLARHEALHIGYLLAQGTWGMGYGTELLKGLVAALRPHAPLELSAGVDATNPASARVLEKAGFTQADDTGVSDMQTYRLSLT